MNRKPSRRTFLKSLGLTLVTAPAMNALALAPEEKPNLILIMADDLGYGDVGCFGSKLCKTPNIDALAKGGLKFTDFHSNGAVCSPTRAALLTGRYQQRCGIEGVITAASHRDTGMPLKETTIAEMLKSAGYVTGIFGKWHLGYPVEYNPIHQGFDEFRGYVSGNVDYHSHIDQAGYEDWWKQDKLVPEEGYSTDLISQHGARFIERHQNETFFLYVPHEATHYPLQGRNDKPQRAKGKPNAGPKPKDVQRAYKEMIEVMDEGIGLIVNTVKKLGLEKKTLIFFCSDNGPTPMGSAGPLRGNKGSLWEGGHRVPGAAYWPGTITPGTETDQPAITMDLYPTFAALANAKVPKKTSPDGVNLTPLLLKGRELPQRSLFWRAGAQTAIRKGDWKLTLNGNGAKGDAKVWLSNLKEDLAESKNLAEAQPQKLAELQAELAAWGKEVSAGVEKRT